GAKRSRSKPSGRARLPLCVFRKTEVGAEQSRSWSAVFHAGRRVGEGASFPLITWSGQYTGLVVQRCSGRGTVEMGAAQGSPLSPILSQPLQCGLSSPAARRVAAGYAPLP